MSCFGSRRLFAALAALLLLVAADAPRALAAGQRVALVVGNAHYANASPLGNPGNDARLIAGTLQGLGFTLVGGGALLDLDKPGFDRAVRSFGAALQGADIALFYYSGHGLQVDGENWLVPVDARLTRPQDLEFVMTDAGAVLRQMQGAGTRLNVLLLDACRDNPFLASAGRGLGRGLAQMQAPEGTLISYATQPGSEALDGSGPDSPYATALAEAMRVPGLDLFQMFNRVGLDVKRATDQQQIPWVSNSPIEGDFFFAGQGAPGAAAALPGLRPPLAAGATGGDAVARGDAAYRSDNYGEALRWYRPAAEAGNASAQNSLGFMYKHGWGVTTDYAEALKWFRRAADHGFAKAQNNLAAMYMNGLGVPQDDGEALHWTRAAADQGDADSEHNLGAMYLNGWGVATDYAEALRWFRRAADQGNGYGQYELGMMYTAGQGVRQDAAAAAGWFRKAADQGVPYAQYELGREYQNGVGVTKSRQQAVVWYRRAAQQGLDDAQQALRRMGEG